MSRDINPLATALGGYYPRHYVVAVLDTPAAATKALAALRDNGFSDATAELCPGADFVRNWNDFVAHRGPLQRLAGLFPSEEQSAIDEYLAAAEDGASFVTVLTPTIDERNRARDLLQAQGAYGMRYYGDRSITDL